MTYVQALNAAPGVSVVRRSADLNGAMHAIRSGEAIAAVYIPRQLERDIVAGKRPQIVIFHNKQYFTPGNIASGALGAAVSAATADLPARGRWYAGLQSRAAGRRTVRPDQPGPELRAVPAAGDPADRAARRDRRLRRAMPSDRSSARAAGQEWLEAAGGDPLTALVGKLAPYLGIFLLLMVA